jgi:molybdate transport system substrate-binding protein
MIKIVLSLVLLCSSIFAGNINIAVAANVSSAIGELVKEFNKTNPNIKVQITLGASGKFATQIQNGAPFDIFLSADMKFPQVLFEKKLTVSEPVIYAKGSLAILSSKELDFSKGINLVSDSSILKIAVANPKTAPYGTATIEALQNSKLLEKVESKFVYGDSIGQTATFAIMAADIGFVAKSSLYDKTMSKYKENINWISVDEALYTPIDQGVIILNSAKNNPEAKAFYNFILSQKAKEIFNKFGYLTK